MPTMLSAAQIGALAAMGQKFDYSGLKNGIDLSHHNGVIDFQKVKDVGILSDGARIVNQPLLVDFVMVKVTQGSAGRDPRAGFNAAECYRVGLPWGPYHFCTLNDKDEVRDATAEAEYLVKRLADLPPYQLPIALDIELEDKVVKLTPEEKLAWIRTFNLTLEKHGHLDHLLYSFSSFLTSGLPAVHTLGATERLWLADYNGAFNVPRNWKKVYLHQYTNVGTVSGIGGPVDLNRVLG